MPIPERWFVSSLKRTGETCGLEWGWLVDPGEDQDGTGSEAGISIGKRGGWEIGQDRGCGIPATVIEVCLIFNMTRRDSTRIRMEHCQGELTKQDFRESVSGGQHNSRSNLTHLRTLFPTFTFPPGMTETDEMWVPETWEKEAEDKMITRLERGLGKVMDLTKGCTCEFLSFYFFLPSAWSFSTFLCWSKLNTRRKS